MSSSASIPSRTVTELDQVRILKLLPRPDDDSPIAELLDFADVVPAREVPADVVTMNSQLRVAEVDGTRVRELTLCYPADADPAAGRVSVLSPMGAALLGQRVGATVTWVTPDGRRIDSQLREILFQPEANGDYVS